MSSFSEIDQTIPNNLKKLLKYRNIPDASTLISKKYNKGKGIIPDDLDQKMKQREYEIVNDDILKTVLYLENISIDELKEKNSHLSGEYPENQFLMIMQSHNVNEKEWKDIFRGGNKLPYIMYPPPKNFTIIHQRFIQIFQDYVSNEYHFKLYCRNILGLLPDESKNMCFYDLYYDQKCKIVNAFYFIFFGLENIPHFIHDKELAKDEINKFKKFKNFYIFDKKFDGKVIDWTEIPLQLFDIDDKPEDFSEDNKKMLRKLIDNIVYYAKVEYKDPSKNSDVLNIRMSFTLIKNFSEKIFSDKDNFNKLPKETQDGLIEVLDLKHDYISLFSMSENGLTYFIRKWTSYYWNTDPKNEKSLKKYLIPQIYFYCPRINLDEMKIHWLKIKVMKGKIDDLKNI